MRVDTERLITVKNFSNFKGVSTTAVYKWISTGRESYVDIDGIKFIKMSLEDKEKYENQKS